MKKNKKIILTIATITISSLLLTGLAFGKKEDNPMGFLWDLIDDLQVAIDDLQNQIDTIELTPGPEGPQGPQGEPGPQGYGYPETGKIWVPCTSFVPRDNDHDFDRNVNSIIVYGDNDQYFCATVQLPHGATVTEVGFYFVDDVDSDYILNLYRVPPRSYGVTPMATVDSSDLSGDTSTSTTSISYSLIDNNNYGYSLALIAPPHINSEDQNARFYTAWISYEYLNVPPVADPNGPYTQNPGLPVQFIGDGSYDTPPGYIVSYEWDFGDGSTSEEVNPTYTYAIEDTYPVTYTVTLTVTDDKGATNTATTEAIIDSGF